MILSFRPEATGSANSSKDELHERSDFPGARSRCLAPLPADIGFPNFLEYVSTREFLRNARSHRSVMRLNFVLADFHPYRRQLSCHEGRDALNNKEIDS
jgi:hypothetical protein